MKTREYSQLLWRKAEQDEFVLCKLVADPEAPDEVIGFHGQQAAEKLIKAVLAAAAIPFRRTHDIAELLDTARDNGIEVPVELEDLDVLVEFEPPASFDRYMGLRIFLEDLLGCRVDLVTTRGLKARARSPVERDAIYVS